MSETADVRQVIERIANWPDVEMFTSLAPAHAMRTLAREALGMLATCPKCYSGNRDAEGCDNAFHEAPQIASPPAPSAAFEAGWRAQQRNVAEYEIPQVVTLDEAWADFLKTSDVRAVMAQPAPSGWQPGEALLNPVNQVYFRAGLLACREYMARFVEAQDSSIAQSIRANWWPHLGADPGPPRKMEWSELTEGEFGTPEFRCKTAEEVSPSIEALPVALGFLELLPQGQHAVDALPHAPAKEGE
jgi:hypothetical protein